MKIPKDQIIFGRHPIMDGLKSGLSFEKIWLQQGTYGDFEKELRYQCKINGVILQVVPKNKIQRLCSGNHQGVVGLQAHIQYYQMEDVLPFLYERKENPLLVMLDGVTDVRNFGAIARSAACFGAQALVTPIKNSALVNADAMKTSAGALNNLKVSREKSLVTAMEFLQLSGLQVFAATRNSGAKPVFETDLTVPCVILLGDEGEGVSTKLLDRCDAEIFIPQTPAVDSLNVSVAAGIILYEVARQRATGKG